MNAYEMTMRGLLDRMFDMDKHTVWLYAKRRACQTETEREAVDQEIRDWWYDWKEYVS